MGQSASIKFRTEELRDGELDGGQSSEAEEFLRLWWRSPAGSAEIHVSLRSLARLAAVALRNRTGRSKSNGHIARRVAPERAVEGADSWTVLGSTPGRTHPRRRSDFGRMW